MLSMIYFSWEGSRPLHIVSVTSFRLIMAMMGW